MAEKAEKKFVPVPQIDNDCVIEALHKWQRWTTGDLGGSVAGKGKREKSQKPKFHKKHIFSRFSRG